MQTAPTLCAELDLAGEVGGLGHVGVDVAVLHGGGACVSECRVEVSMSFDKPTDKLNDET